MSKSVENITLGISFVFIIAIITFGLIYENDTSIIKTAIENNCSVTEFKQNSDTNIKLEIICKDKK